MLAGIWLRTAASTARKAAMLAVSGAVMLVVALAWNPYFPINKKLWTSSYAIFAGGCSLVLLALCLALIDLWRLGRSPGESSDPPCLSTQRSIVRGSSSVPMQSSRA